MTGSGGSDLRAPIFNGKKVDEEGSSESEKVSLLMKDAKALGIIQGAVSDDIFPRISNEETSKGAWDVLHQEFHGDKQVRSIKLQGLRRDFEYTRMKDDETLSVYLTRLLELVNQMKGYEEDLSKGRLVQKLLISLIKKFDPNCYVTEQMKDIETIEVQKVLAALRGFAQRLDRHAKSTIEKAFSSMSINQKGSQSNSSFGNNKSKKNWKSMGKPKCYGCNRFGHYIKECDQANKARKVANIANQVTEPATLFYACHSATIGKNMNMWYVDSACSNHMTSHESLLVNIDKNVKCRVKMGTGDLVQSTGKGTLVIEMQGVTRYIKEVMIVPGLDENLLSMQDLIASVPMKGNRCFPLSLEYVKPYMANKVTVEESSWRWHKRYGHLNYTSLMLLQDKEMVQGLPRLQVTKHVCFGCATGKGHREPFDKEKVWRASQPLELIHSDICGQMQTITLGGNRYFLTFIDDHTRMCWVFFLQHKSQAFNIFKRFKNTVELQSGYQIKKLRSDRGGEYT
ncbi:hypothetical protein L3X38_032790 [Prunus dulcis]|uniref:CCHC-type domain-containing protein n=1 Tax=Prunus dulcis TaxID=3755 RepID=A0AAD4VEZ5_PRUDU|nr:hypothetical protein L3X38_032790 [Prunus dulcis]